MTLATILQEQMETKTHGNIYHFSQIKMAYNSNRIEGSKLTEDETKHIFETGMIASGNADYFKVDDIIETVNHFSAFDYVLQHYDETLNSEHIKKMHYILKSGTLSSKKSWFKVGDYKLLENTVSNITTSSPENVAKDIDKLLSDYENKKNVSVEDIIDFHYKFECIHPFQDGNGRVGRLIIFKECLKNNIVPFIIDETHKQYYYRGLSEYPKVKGYLLDTCLSSQDNYKAAINKFVPMLLKDEKEL